MVNTYQQQVPVGPEAVPAQRHITDRDIADDCLALEKLCCETYLRAALEAHNSPLKNRFAHLVNQSMTSADSCYRWLHRRGHYPLLFTGPGEIRHVQNLIQPLLTGMPETQPGGPTLGQRQPMPPWAYQPSQ